MAFVRNTWYCAGWSKDFSRQPITRTLLGEPLMLWRNEAGEAVILSNRCTHRFAPLHKGCVQGDTVACPYHGLKFDSRGQCVHNPHGDGHIPKAAHLRSYPVVERDGVVWVWMGEAAKADVEQILPVAHTGFLQAAEQFSVATGHLEVSGNYLLVMDNLLDLTHAPYVHPKTVGGAPEDSVEAGMQVGIEEDDRSITSTYFCPSMKPTPQLRPLFREERGDFRIRMRWQPASSLAMRLSMTPCDQADGSGVVLPLLHLLTPIDEYRTHYFFALGRNVALGVPEADAEMAEFARRAFEEEDEPMISACQAQMGTTDLFSLRPVLLQTDVANVKARRRVEALIAQEAGR